MTEFLRVWFSAIGRPGRAFGTLEGKPAPGWGLASTLVRFVGTALTSILALRLLDYQPFVPSYLTFLDDSNYYRAEVFFLPLFGIVAWLLSSALVHLILRISGQESNIDWILNVVGFSLLVVMPLVWMLDWSGIAFGFYGASFTIPIHAGVSIWEVALMGVGFRRLGRLGWVPALLLGLVVKAGVYIPLAAVFVR
ncbi:MAG: YIP1 family protein [Anaerolineae bacterium]|jgi:hypothetical protein